MNKRSHHYLTYAIVALIFGVATCMIMFKIPTILTRLMEIIECDANDASIFMSSYTLISCIFALPVVLLLRKLGPLQIAVIGAAFALVGSILGAFSVYLEGDKDYYLLAISRGIEGINYVFASICLPMLIKNSVDKKNTGVCLSIYSVFFPLGSFIGTSLTPIIFTSCGFEFTWLIYAGVMLVAGLLLLYVFKDTKTVVEASDNKKHNPASPASIVFFMVSWCLFCLMQIAMLNYFPIYLNTHFGMDSSLSGLLTTLPSLICIPLCIFAGHLSDKFGTYKYVYVVTLALLTPGLFLIFTTEGAALVIGYILVTLGLVCPAVNAIAVFELFCSKYSGIGMALLIAVCCLGQSIGSWIMQVLIGNDFTGWLQGAIFLLVCGIVAVICAVLARSQRRPLSNKK